MSAREPVDSAEKRERALERLRRQDSTPEATLAGEAEASLRSAFALADLLNALHRR
jgi:hypothetical protein